MNWRWEINLEFSSDYGRNESHESHAVKPIKSNLPWESLRSPYAAVTAGKHLLLTLNERVNELAGWEGRGEKPQRGDSPYRGYIDKSHSSSLHIQPDNWALRRSQCQWVRPVMRKPHVNGSSWACDLCNGKHLRSSVKGEKLGQERKYRIIWSHMST